MMSVRSSNFDNRSALRGRLGDRDIDLLSTENLRVRRCLDIPVRSSGTTRKTPFQANPPRHAGHSVAPAFAKVVSIFVMRISSISQRPHVEGPLNIGVLSSKRSECRRSTDRSFQSS